LVEQTAKIIPQLLLWNKWSKQFDEKPHRTEQIFHAGQFNVTPNSLQHCSLLQQWRCDAVTDLFAAHNATMTQDAVKRARQPPKLPLPIGDLDPHLIMVARARPSQPPQTASQSVQPFFARLMNMTNRQTDRHTDRPRYSVCSNRLHLAIAVMRTKN